MANEEQSSHYKPQETSRQSIYKDIVTTAFNILQKESNEVNLNGPKEDGSRLRRKVILQSDSQSNEYLILSLVKPSKRMNPGEIDEIHITLAQYSQATDAVEVSFKLSFHANDRFNQENKILPLSTSSKNIMFDNNRLQALSKSLHNWQPQTHGSAF